MTEPDSGWRESVDHVVSDFDVVTRHLRVRQGQALRVAWSVVLATAIAIGALIVLSLRPSAPSIPVASLPATPAPLAIAQPGGVLFPGAGLGLLPTSAPGTENAAPSSPSAVSAPSAIPAPAPRPATPVPAPAPVSPVRVSLPAPATAVTAPPATPVATPAPPQGIVDGLVTGVLRLVG